MYKPKALSPRAKPLNSMKKVVSKQGKKVSSKRNFEREYAEIMKGVQMLPAPQWNKPGDAFTKLSLYTEHANSTSTNSSI